MTGRKNIYKLHKKICKYNNKGEENNLLLNGLGKEVTTEDRLICYTFNFFFFFL